MKDQSQLPCGLRRQSAVDRLMGWWVESCPGNLRLSLSCECCMLSGTDLWDRLITFLKSPTECGRLT
jgi:hypothetical protein